jgi:hypothetical protein
MNDIWVAGGNTDVLAMLARNDVRFLVVGGVAVRFYIDQREVDDLDILVDNGRDNAERCMAAIGMLGYESGFDVHDIMKPKVRIPLKHLHYAELLTPAADFDFEAELSRSATGQVNGWAVQIAAPELLIEMKTGTGRDRDSRDIELLQSKVSETKT